MNWEIRNLSGPLVPLWLSLEDCVVSKRAGSSITSGVSINGALYQKQMTPVTTGNPSFIAETNGLMQG